MDKPPSPPQNGGDLRARIEALRRERGFLLPHHGAMAAAMPDLLDAYLALYRALTLTGRHLTPFEKEFVWLAVLIGVGEAVGTHHVDLFRKAGGSDRQAALAAGVAALALGSDAFAFMDRHWRTHFPGLDGTKPYHAAVERLLAGADLPAGAAHLALAAAAAAAGRRWGVAAGIEAACAEGVAEEKLAEALSLVMWPAGVNRFLEACAVWRDLMVSGRVKPSERFRIWAETPRQGGFDERF